MQNSKDHKGTFLLGVGAQKCGTTWLYRYLKSNSTTNLGLSKEYHIWDAISVGECANFRQKLWKVRNAKQFTRWRMQTNASFYFDYFEKLLDREGIRLTADITPTYSALAAPDYLKIKTGFDERDIGVKVVFLMRDPVERVWSAMRMYRRKSPGRLNISPDMEENEALLMFHKAEKTRIRATYNETITNLESIYSADQVFIGLYETLFEKETLKTVSDFLGIPTNLKFVEKRFNVSSKKTELSDFTRRIIANDFRDIYDFCGERFPETLEKWSGFKYLD